MTDQIANAVAKRDSMPRTQILSQIAFISDAGSNNTWHIEVDSGTNPWLRIRQIDADGDVIEAKGEVVLDLASLETSGMSAGKRKAAFRLEYARDKDTCAVMKRAVLATEWEAV